ncbi:hypothetical protein [Psychroserpens sp. SPM9]|uniref:hypothetical protein n=1 Tax=Psychroserpens sp. SPM9 TaxID=2975598 RepID=UPI0021A60944|nr:hypothetical protein [Psychroserpens sp. SPM9]MDG5493010.1 hypothetical protein [Psychroserpens sp. SPM9]
MKTIFQLAILILVIISCSNSDTLAPEPDQYSGIDLFSEMSDQERTLLGTWSFGYEIFKLNSGNDSIVYHSLLNYGNTDRTDSIKFYASKFVGFEDYCPIKAPNTLANKLKTYYLETAYISACFPTYNGGWYIENNRLYNYWGLDGSAETMESFLIEEINNDSLVFVYRDSTNINLNTATKRTAVFYKL